MYCNYYNYRYSLPSVHVHFCAFKDRAYSSSPTQRPLQTWWARPFSRSSFLWWWSHWDWTARYEMRNLEVFSAWWLLPQIQIHKFSPIFLISWTSNILTLLYMFLMIAAVSVCFSLEGWRRSSLLCWMNIQISSITDGNFLFCAWWLSVF